MVWAEVEKGSQNSKIDDKREYEKCGRRAVVGGQIEWRAYRDRKEGVEWHFDKLIYQAKLLELANSFYFISPFLPTGEYRRAWLQDLLSGTTPNWINKYTEPPLVLPPIALTVSLSQNVN